MSGFTTALFTKQRASHSCEKLSHQPNNSALQMIENAFLSLGTLRIQSLYKTVNAKQLHGINCTRKRLAAHVRCTSASSDARRQMQNVCELTAGQWSLTEQESELRLLSDVINGIIRANAVGSTTYRSRQHCHVFELCENDLPRIQGQSWLGMQMAGVH